MPFDFVLFEPRLRAVEINGKDVPVPAEVLTETPSESLLARIERWARSLGLITNGVRVAMFDAA
ncbi:MAG TPA: hypothetical protein PLN91_00705 [Rhodanobacteraceae bacterium]|nr:hypothetical protein [Rhodanobacteraceae bacterium]